jgi:hypothetical protein
MTTIEHSIVIPAPAAVVWSRLTDTQRFPSWNPFISELTGDLKTGSKLSVRINPPGGKAMSFAPTVTVVEQGRRLEWLGRMGIPGIFDGRHSFTLEQIDDHTTRLTQAERFTGCLVPFTGSLLRRTAAGFEAMNQALRTESVAAFADGGEPS